jgi:hypothetical protein
MTIAELRDRNGPGRAVGTRLVDLDASVVVEYLDLDDDGVVDAVHVQHAVARDLTGDGNPDVVEIVDEVAAAIDIDGVPHRVERWSRPS